MPLYHPPKEQCLPMRGHVLVASVKIVGTAKVECPVNSDFFFFFFKVIQG